MRIMKKQWINKNVWKTIILFFFSFLFIFAGKVQAAAQTEGELEEKIFPGTNSSSLQKTGEFQTIGGHNYYLYTAELRGKNCYDKAFQVLEIVNKERKNLGLNTLKMDPGLLKSAMQRSSEISTYFDHFRPFGGECFTVNSKVYGENIASGQMSADSVMSAWMGSSGHRSNIVKSDYTAVGIGCVRINNVYYWTQFFGYHTVNNEAEVSQYENKLCDYKVYYTKDEYAGNNLKAYSYKTIIEGDEVGEIQMAFVDSTVTPIENAVYYRSSNPRICSIDSKGKFTGISKGTATITVTLENDPDIKRSVQIQVTSNARYSSATANPTESSKGGGSSKQSSAVKKTSIISLRNLGTRAATIQWKKTPGVSGYRLMYTGGGRTVVFTIRNRNKTSKTIRGLQKNKVYTFRIRNYTVANNRRVYSSWSAKKKIRIKK